MRYPFSSDHAKFGAYLSGLAVGVYSLFTTLVCLLTCNP